MALHWPCHTSSYLSRTDTELVAQIDVLLCCYVNDILPRVGVITLVPEDFTSSYSNADALMRLTPDCVLILTPCSLSLCADVCVNRKMMEVCGEAENRLASELMQHELQIEKEVLDPLSQLAEVSSLTPSVQGVAAEQQLFACLKYQSHSSVFTADSVRCIWMQQITEFRAFLSLREHQILVVCTSSRNNPP